MGASSNPQKRRLYKAIAAGVSVLLLSVGFIAGFFTARQMGAWDLTACYASIQQQSSNISKTSDSSALRELPPPGSEEAKQLAKKPGALDPFEAELYTLYSDAETITEESTAKFLQQLEQQLSANAAAYNLQRPGQNMTQTLEEFSAVAADILNYFRERSSQALLSMLRQFSQQGTFTLADVDPDVLQQEVQQILNVDQLGKYYARMSQRGGEGITTRPATGAQGTPQVQTEAGTPRGRSTNSTNNRRLQGAPRQPPRARHLLAPPAAAAAATSAAAAAAATPAPAAAAPAAAEVSGARRQPGNATAAAASMPVKPKAASAVSPLMTLQEMLCGVEDKSRTGLQGILLPTNRNGTGRGEPIVCPPSSESAVTLYNKLPVKFKPVKIPVVFHCMRFKRPSTNGDVTYLLPLMHEAQQAADNLIELTNGMFKTSKIQFELQEVRYDAEKYPYLLFNTQKEWLDCAGTPAQEAATPVSFPCLKKITAMPQVAPLVKQHVLNVFVTGSQPGITPYCQRNDGPGCFSTYAGYVGSAGPWFAQPSKTWSEDAVTENWMFLSWDQFSTAVMNKPPWNGGAVTFAHEVGHYVGLMHTHQGGCAGDEETAADAVPDTPLNENIAAWAGPRRLTKLAAWCTAFRNGKQPDPKDLLQFNSCESPYGVDNVFNLLSYLPDECCMLLTTNQIARMQWAIAKFRPKMMAKYAVK